jgi:hypothetical protein
LPVDFALFLLKVKLLDHVGYDFVGFFLAVEAQVEVCFFDVDFNTSAFDAVHFPTE